MVSFTLSLLFSQRKGLYPFTRRLECPRITLDIMAKRKSLFLPEISWLILS
jgi:hypothetical protein